VAQEQRRRGPLGWIKRGLLGLAIGLVALAIIGATYQVIATEIDKRAYPPPGKLVEVNGHLMHINCMGEGGPTVILESGLANMSADWANIQPQLAKTTRVCAYDRAGMGWSESGPQPRDARHISSELHTLLDNAGIEGPTAASTRGCMPPATLTKQGAWSWSTLRIRSSSRAPHKGGRHTNRPGGWLPSIPSSHGWG
jgi:hypothetical protein